nr:RecName: Full=Hainantoxin F5-22.36; AltName: Full=Peptide F5-22.36 [Haplopelma hainanum]
CNGRDVPCDPDPAKNRRCCSGLECLKPYLHGTWYQDYCYYVEK